MKRAKLPFKALAQVIDKADGDALVRMLDYKLGCFQSFWFPGSGLRRGQRVTVTIAPARKRGRR